MSDDRNDGQDGERERFWRGLLAGLMLSSAFVGALAGLWHRLRSRPAPESGDHPPEAR
jgi:hypothetical protein